MNEIQFNEQHMTVFKKMCEVNKQIKSLQETEKRLKENLEEGMFKHGIKSINNEFIKITYVDGSSTTSIDVKELKSKEPDLYEELIGDYPKITTKKSYVRFTIK